MGIRNFNYKQGEDWFEPVLNIHTPLSPAVAHFLFARLQISQKNICR
jgi:hypothetical protein